MINILFVCTGNTCRSPMAEAILKSKRLPNVEVKSAGVYAMDGMHASKHAKEVLNEKQIEHVHRSRLLTQKEIDWATYILTMTTAHKETILLNFLNTETKVFTTKEFARDSQLDIIDPFGGDVENYRETFQDLERTVDKIIEKFDLSDKRG